MYVMDFWYKLVLGSLQHFSSFRATLALSYTSGIKKFMDGFVIFFVIMVNT